MPRIWFFLQKFFNRRFLCSVVGIIRDDQNRILLLNHTYRSDPIALPSGFIKKGETPFAALKREIKEETNFDITPHHILNVIPSKTYSHLEFIISATYKSGEFIPSREIDSFSWSFESEIQITIDKLLASY